MEDDGRVYFCSDKKGLYDIEAAIKRIPPGKILRVNKEGLSIHQGVIIERPQIDITDFDEAMTLYKDAITEAVEKMFNGQGADELFAGYWWYKNVLKEESFVKLHDKLWEDIDLAYDDTLEREDKVTMANSIELRVPYLDRNVVQCAMRISPRLKIKDNKDLTRKWVHRRVAEEYFEGKKVEAVELADKGSNYRYLDDDYGTPEMWAYMHEITKENQCLE